MHVRIAKPQWRGKRSRHSRRTRIPQYYVFGKRPIQRKTNMSNTTFESPWNHSYKKQRNRLGKYHLAISLLLLTTPLVNTQYHHIDQFDSRFSVKPCAWRKSFSKGTITQIRIQLTHLWTSYTVAYDNILMIYACIQHQNNWWSNFARFRKHCS